MNTPLIPDPLIPWPPGHAPASAIVFAQNTVEIAATPDTVWGLLIDCVSWPSWYKHCSDATILTGGPVLGAGSRFRFKTMGLYFEPKVETFQPAEMLVWSAKGPAGSSGAHAWRIGSTSRGCRVVTEEAQRGFVLSFVRSRTRHTLLNHHQEWLRSLQQLAEAGGSIPRSGGRPAGSHCPD